MSAPDHAAELEQGVSEPELLAPPLWPPLAPSVAVALASGLLQAQTRFRPGSTVAAVFEPMLQDLLEATGSRVGFIGEMLRHPSDGHRYVRLLAPWEPGAEAACLGEDDSNEVGPASTRPYDEPRELHEPDSLPATVLATTRAVLCNDGPVPAAHAGFGQGERALDSFAGFPLTRAGELLGLVVLGDRPGGYDRALAQALEPLMQTCAATIESNRLDRALTECRRRVEQSFEMPAVGIGHVDLQGRFLRVNKKLAGVLGLEPQALVGRTMRDIGPEMPDELERQHGIRELLSGAVDTVSAEQRFCHASGRALWGALTVSLARDPRGEPAYYIVVLEDTTARKEADEHLLAAQAERQANQAKTRFLSQMSHELRTPLNAVLGFAQVLAMDPNDPLSPGQAKRLLHIENAGKHLLSMIDDVLDLARIESGGMLLSLEPVSVLLVVEQARVLVESAAKAAGVSLHIEPPTTASPPGRADDAARGRADAAQADYVQADAVRLRQAVVNLLSNAIKYNRQGGSVRVSWGLCAGGSVVRLQVRDTGRGMSAKQLEHLFEPFNRLGAEQTAVQGTGMGLVVTKRLVELMHGRVGVESAVRVGTVFSIELPTGRVAQPATVEMPAADTLALDALPRRRVVLYAEDNELNVELLRGVMAMRNDVELVVASSGQRALDYAQAHRPDAFLLDMHLGDMNGLQLKRALSAYPHLDDVPFVALSADAMPAATLAAERAGFVSYLTKPLQVPALFAALDAAFGLGDNAEEQQGGSRS